MKKLFTLTSIFFLSILVVNAQRTPKIMSSAKFVQSIKQNGMRSVQPGQNTITALWDIQFSHDLVPINVVSCVYTGTEFWVGRYTTDTLYTLDTMGVVTSTFVVAGVGSATVGIRGLTYDGTNVFAVTGANKVIYKINPTTHALVGSNTATLVPFSLRSIAFDSTANAGAGGFWVTNWSTAPGGGGFYHISRTGAVLDSIGLTTHGLLGVYGLAFDPYTAGGPYLWANDQGAGTECTLKRVSIATGATSVTHDVNADFGTGVISGSVSITWRYRPGTWTIMGIGQTTPSLLFGYELNDYVQAVLDASADSISFDPPYTIIPITEILPYTWTVKSTNNGATAISDLSTQFRLTDSTVDYFAPPPADNLNVASNASVYNTFGPFTPAMGFYYLQADVNTNSQADVVPGNDTLTVPFLSVEDSVFARDNSQATGSLGIGDSVGGTLGQYFTLSRSAYITSGTFFLTGPAAGDSTSLDLYDFAGTPQTILASSPSYTFTAADTNGVVLTLSFPTPYFAAAGDYFLGVNEHAVNVTLGRTAFNYHPNTTFVTFTGQPWAASETFGFPVTYVLRLNIDASTVGMTEHAASQFSVFPNPSTGKVYMHNEGAANSEYEINVFNNMGQLVYERNGQRLTNNSIDLSGQTNGVYHVQIKSQSSITNETVVISHN